LRKMERAGIVREIKALKNKLKFDAKAHKWENLSILSDTVLAEYEAKYKESLMAKRVKNKNKKIISNSAVSKR
jgi:hypothetical protein